MTIPTMPLSPTQRGDTPFTPASDTPSRVNTLRNMYATRGRMDTSTKTIPPTKAKHWTEKPDLVKTMHESIQLLIDERDLLDENADLFTPESFIATFKIDTTLPYSEARKAAHVAANKAYADAIFRDLEEHGVKPEHYAQAWMPFASLDEAMTSTGVSLKSLKLKINAFTAGYFKERAIETINRTAKEQPAMTESELKKPSDPFPKAAAATPDPISALKLRLWNMIADVFGDKSKSDDENKPIISKHMMLALKADNFNDFIMHHNPIDKAAEVGVCMVDDYITANTPKRGATLPAAAPVTPPQSAPTKQSAFADYDLNEQQIRERYTIKVSGNDYLKAAGRILLFRIKHRGGNIPTTIISMDEKGALVRAEVFDENGKQLATAHAYTSASNSAKFQGRYLEKAETSAIGRALAIAGFGTDAAGEDIDEDDQLSDSPVERKVA